MSSSWGIWTPDNIPLPVTIARLLAIPIATFDTAVLGWGIQDTSAHKYNMDLQPIVSAACAASAFSLVWSLIANTFARKIFHPAWFLGLDLIAWTFLVIVGIIAIVSVQLVAEEEGLLTAACCLTLPNALFHFGVFAWACRKVDEKNREKKRNAQLPQKEVV